MPDPTISKALYTVNENSDNEEQKLYGIPLTISKYIKSLINLIDYNNQTFFHITMGLEDLLKKIKKEKEKEKEKEIKPKLNPVSAMAQEISKKIKEEVLDMHL